MTGTVVVGEFVQLSEDLPRTHLVNEDIAPTDLAHRTWNSWHIASLWVGMSVCIPTYMLASSMIQAGMNWWQALLGAVGGVIVCDYLVVRRGVLALRDLYLTDGAYQYQGGVNRNAMIALIAGIVTALLGLAHPNLRFLFNGAWFSAAIVSFGSYWWLMKGRKGRKAGWRTGVKA